MVIALKNLGLFVVICAISVDGIASAEDLGVVTAAQSRDNKAIRSLVKERANVNAAQADGATALAWAAYYNDVKMADLLIAAGADVNAANEYGITPLWLACTNGSGPMVAKLLKGRADANRAQWSGATPLMMCARTGSPDAVKSLLARKAEVNAAETKHGQTALMWAAAESHPQIVELLIEAGADVNASTKGGTTALMFAAQQGDIESARLLLAAGAEINVATNSQATWVGDTPLLLAAASGHEAMAIFLLEEGADPDAADEFGFTALHFSMIESLQKVTGVRSGVNHADLWDSYLFRDNMVNLVEALLAHGANPNARISKYGGGNKLLSTRLNDPAKYSVHEVGATPFFLAAQSHDTKIMRMLVKAGADPRLATVGETTPLIVATGLIRQRDLGAMPYTAEQADQALEAVKLCVELGADVNAANDVGLTALHGAAYSGLDEVIRFLVEHGANVNAKDATGQTPLHKAMNIKPQPGVDYKRNGHDIFVPYVYYESTTELLLKLGATPVESSVVARQTGEL